MQTIHLRVKDSVYERLITLIHKFKDDEVQIIPEDAHFLQNKKYLDEELQEIQSGKAEFISMEEFEKRLDAAINSHENRD